MKEITVKYSEPFPYHFNQLMVVIRWLKVKLFPWEQWPMSMWLTFLRHLQTSFYYRSIVYFKDLWLDEWWTFISIAVQHFSNDLGLSQNRALPNFFTVEHHLKKFTNHSTKIISHSLTNTLLKSHFPSHVCWLIKSQEKSQLYQSQFIHIQVPWSCWLIKYHKKSQWTSHDPLKSHEVPIS